MADYKITTIKYLRQQGWQIADTYDDGDCPTYLAITSEIPVSGVSSVDVSATCVATSEAYSDNQLVCESDVRIVKTADCPAQSDVVFLPSYSNYQSGTVDNLLAFNSGNTKFSSIKSLSLTSGDWLSDVAWSSNYKDGDTAWPFIKFTQTENTSTTTDRTGVITVVMNATSGGECDFPITVTQGRHTSICPSFEDVVADGSGQPVTEIIVPNTSTGCTTGCTGFLWFKTGDTAFSSTGSVTPDGTVITGASFGNSTSLGYCFIVLKFEANTTTTDKNGSVTIKMNATNGDECSYTVPITLKGLPVSVITYSASTKLNVDLNDFTPAATAETFSNGIGKIEFDDVVTGIGEKAFFVKTAMTGIDIPYSITSIGNYAFANCNNLKDITIPSGVTYINDYVLYGCTNLSSVTLENSLVQLKTHSIADCPNLRKIELTTATADNYYATDALENSADCPIYVPEESLHNFWNHSSTQPYINRVISHIGNNCVVYKASQKLTGGNLGEAYSASSDTSTKLSIQSHTFDSSKGIGKICYSGPVGSFHNATFDTQPITYIILPENLKLIGQEVFVSSTLESIFIPDSVVRIGNTNGGCSTFHNNKKLKRVVAGSGLTAIGTSCFTTGDAIYTGFTFYSTSAPALTHKNTFENTGSCPIYVPCGQVSTYQSANIWNDSDIKNRIKAIPPCTY